MTIKELIKIASNDEAMRILDYISESIKNDISATEYELKEESKVRREKAKEIIDLISTNNEV